MSSKRWIVIIDFDGPARDLKARDWTVIPYREFEWPELFISYGHLKECSGKGNLWDTNGCRGAFAITEDGFVVTNDKIWDYGDDAASAWERLTGIDWPRHE